jgi:protein TonB
MFEDSLMESQNRLSSPNQRWTAVLSLTLQCAVAAAIIALPLLHPEALPFHTDAPKVFLPLQPLPRPVPRPVPRVEATTASASPATPAPGHPITGPLLIPTLLPSTSDAAPATGPIGTGMGDSDTLTSALGTPTGTAVRVSPARPAPTRPLLISTGVMNGLLLAPIKPIYPRIAISARIGGAVIVEAIISKSGRIESAHAVSGPEILRQAALDAIRNARYSPYLLNGAPTEVETTITVNFNLSS